MKTRPVYYKSVEPESLTVDSESRTVSGYLASFGNVDMAKDVLIKGCFAKSIQDRGPEAKTAGKIAYLWQHEMDEPIGHFTKLLEDEAGLYFEAYIDDTQLGNETLKQYASGTLNQHSIGFQYVWDKCKIEKRQDAEGNEIEVFVCYELKLFEGSVVTLGCNENTPFTGFKAADMIGERTKLNKQSETLLKDLTPSQAYQVRQLISKHIALNEAEREPGKTTPPEVEPQTVDLKKVAEVFKHSLKN